MSKNITHGKTTERTTTSHEKRILAIERSIGGAYATAGVPTLRDALYAASGTMRTGEQSRNFDPVFAAASLAPASGSRRYMACYWPGGPCTGMTMLQTVPGVYTDAALNSGAGIFSSDGTLLTLQAVNQRRWIFAAGLNRVPWIGGPYVLAATVYYVCIEYFASAVTTAPQFGSCQTIDPTIWGGDTASDLTPAGWPLVFTQTGVSTQMPATASIAGLTVGAVLTVPYVGLY